MTGLRRREIGSLTPSSFDLDASPAIMKVEAACSKHRKLDVLPLHPQLAILLRDWVSGLASDQALFPRVERKKTWLMVRKELERVGIPYETEAGIADFHASRRHSYVTGLLRNGASITEAKELARHADVRMTMRYTHIGLDDQARALAGLPMPAPPAEGALQMRCISRGAEGHSSAPADTREPVETPHPETTNPRQGGGCVVGSPELSSPGSPGELWRRRELHPSAHRHKSFRRITVVEKGPPVACTWPALTRPCASWSRSGPTCRRRSGGRSWGWRGELAPRLGPANLLYTEALSLGARPRLGRLGAQTGNVRQGNASMNSADEERPRRPPRLVAAIGLPLGLLFLVIALNRPNIANLGFHDIVQFLGAGVTLGAGLAGLIVYLVGRRKG